MILAFVYFTGCLLWLLGMTIFVLYKHQYTDDIFYEDREGVILHVILLGLLVGVFWPLAIVVLTIIFLANKILQQLVKK